MAAHRHYTFLDRLCLGVDQAVRALADTVKTTGADYPGKDIEEQQLSDGQRKHSAALMRINHAGEICAQALYHGQGVVSRSTEVQEKMHQAAIEEGDHLAWCRQRLSELDSHPSYFNPIWYAGSFFIGMAAGMVGDKWSLGFVAETEHQVINHLKGHLHTLPAQHRDDAVSLGAKGLPSMIKKGMALTSKIMVKTAYWI
jgi:3-demethoxyubiquinol 3-hydroxylase